jgi:MULE transposase domain/FLYWCH zinc finger domain
MAKLVMTERGKQNLHTESYVYNFHSNSKDMERKYWRCIHRTLCNGRCTTNFNIHTNIEIIEEKNHLHEANPAENKSRELVASIKRKAVENPNQPPNAIFLEATENIQDEEVLENLPEKHSLFRTINRHQNKERPALPRTMEDLEILAPYDVTLNNDNFFQYDTGSDDPNRILVFYTSHALQQLVQSRTIFCDGTFKTVPTMFYQLYTIHGEVNDYVYPLVYALCTNKSSETYRDIFEHLKNAAIESNQVLRPHFIVSDFELAAINAARTVFPQSTLHGCLFHLNQAIWRKAVNLGLKVQFSHDKDIRDSILKLLALPFVPLDDVENVFQELKNEIHESVDDLATYIEVTYILGKPARGRRRAVAPRFPMELWNVYEMTLSKMQRTNNIVEGWNSRFQKLINAHHATVWKFLDFIKKDQRQNEILIIQSLGGHRVKKPISKSSLTNQTQVERIVRKYQKRKDDGEIGRYLLSLSHKLKLRTVDADEETQSE